MAITLSGCASKALDYKPKQIKRDYNASWQHSFNISELNALIAAALKNNEDLASSAFNLSTALHKAGLKKSDLFPTPSANFNANSKREINRHDGSARAFNTAFALSWELDIWGRVYDAYISADFSAIASSLNLQDIQITIVNSVISQYFRILYLNEKEQNLIINLKNMQDLDEIVQNKVALGRAEPLELAQSKENLLSTQNALHSTRRELQSAYETLANLTRSELMPSGFISDISRPRLDFGIKLIASEDLGFKNASKHNASSEDLGFKNASEHNASSANLGFNKANELKIAWSERILKRPDVNAALAMLNAGFYDYSAAQKDFLPSISLNGSLSDNDTKLSKSYSFNLLSGALSVSLPFLDYARLKQNLLISENEFNILRLSYEKALNNAINEAIKYASFYEIDSASLDAQAKIVREREQIVEIYALKYEQGKAELKDLLEAQNALLSAKNTLANQKYFLIDDEINFYKASAY